MYQEDYDYHEALWFGTTVVYEEDDAPYDCDDEYLEMGFNPYDGCYDYDC